MSADTRAQLTIHTSVASVRMFLQRAEVGIRPGETGGPETGCRESYDRWGHHWSSCGRRGLDAGMLCPHPPSIPP